MCVHALSAFFFNFFFFLSSLSFFLVLALCSPHS